MRIVVQRVRKCRVSIGGNLSAEIGSGMLILLGIEATDSVEDINWLCKKIIGLRVFNNDKGKMNLDIKTVDGDIMVVSQFTLYASTRKGNRPSFIKAAPPEMAIPLYSQFISVLEEQLQKPIKTGEFGADMQIELINDGPVTIIIDSKNKE